MILFAGALLLTPGFFTDTIGFLLLVPAFRVGVMRFVRSRMQVQSFTVGSGEHQSYTENEPSRGRGTVIDGEYFEVDESDRKPGNSGWTKH